MEYGTKMRKYILLDANVSNFIDLNGWPREVMILEVKGLERAFDTDCILFDPENSLSFKYMIQLLDEKHLDYREV